MADLKMFVDLQIYLASIGADPASNTTRLFSDAELFYSYCDAELCCSKSKTYDKNQQKLI